MNHEPTPADAELRLRAQERLSEQRRALASGEHHLDNPQRLLHELQVHQIELQLQNEQLEAARAWIEAALASYTELFDFAPVPYFTLDRVGKIAELNLAAARLLGIERARVIDKRLGVFVAESDRSRLAACLKSLFATMSDAHCEVVIVAKDGARRTVEVRTTLSNNGEACRAVVIDVSARSAAGEQMRRQAQVFARAPDAMFISDQQGVISDVNNAFGALTGYAPEEVLGQHQGLLRGAEQAPGLDQDIMLSLALHGRWRGAVWLRRRDGELVRLTQQIDSAPPETGEQGWVGRFSQGD
ncbi:PAS domain-containing protein [Massilia sp. CCM 8734]|uniref:PAS domain-containing protein n=1 Tax=Massilia sp. CCM 8734 TaxID=2609283 RepID=UPI0014237E58|nr:PAS domain-containing protein [Massilia sp. CCM 8734]NHZ96175.1 PAS domain S-box protein [Massilia sp. CCM 8734]